MTESIKALEVKTSMLFNLDFTNNNSSYCTNPAVIAQIFNPIAKLVIPIGIPTKEEKSGIEVHPVIVEAKIRKCSI